MSRTTTQRVESFLGFVVMAWAVLVLAAVGTAVHFIIKFW